MNDRFDSTRSGVSPIVGSYNPVRTAFGTFFRVAFCILLFIAIFRILGGSSERLTFTGLLHSLQSVPQVDTSWILSIRNYADSVRDIPLIGSALAFIANLVTVAMYGAVAVYQVMRYVVYIAGYLFV